MKFPRTLRLDTSDLYVFRLAAEPGEWAVPGSFAFLGRNSAQFDNKEKLAFRSGWLGTESFGRATLSEVAEIGEAEFFQVVERLARHFVEHYGAPDLAAALPAAREEADLAASLCDHKTNTLLALEREHGPAGLVERFRVIRPDRARDHARIWEVLPDPEDSEGAG
ncbi:MAG: DUF6505 family protein [Rhodospirillales bacterium]|nr:DUF6505 family protein [Rhodospirillales bacterium]MDH3910453.1 DUF6505 family protein [Rhodospirillales bacterium]MDH3916863.1 DUF6505 family protein [Rhodospirillales bacterium]MDH3969956.1 DUF6505 family protein [Rhodospirillales bacterium]